MLLSHQADVDRSDPLDPGHGLLLADSSESRQGRPPNNSIRVQKLPGALSIIVKLTVSIQALLQSPCRALRRA